jgi:hypothetical protein
MTGIEVIILITFIVLISTILFLAFNWDTPYLKDMVDKETKQQQLQTFKRELTPHIKEVITNTEVVLEEALQEIKPNKKRKYYPKKKK